MLLFVVVEQLTKNTGSDSKLDPQLRMRLLKESKSPFRGLRRVIWIALFGSSFIGISIMTLRASSGNIVPLSDAGIQIGALLIFGCLLFFDRQKDD